MLCVSCLLLTVCLWKQWDIIFALVWSRIYRAVCCCAGWCLAFPLQHSAFMTKRDRTTKQARASCSQGLWVLRCTLHYRESLQLLILENASGCCRHWTDSRWDVFFGGAIVNWLEHVAGSYAIASKTLLPLCAEHLASVLAVCPPLADSETGNFPQVKADSGQCFILRDK